MTNLSASVASFISDTHGTGTPERLRAILLDDAANTGRAGRREIDAIVRAYDLGITSESPELWTPLYRSVAAEIDQPSASAAFGAWAAALGVSWSTDAASAEVDPAASKSIRRSLTLIAVVTMVGAVALGAVLVGRGGDPAERSAGSVDLTVRTDESRIPVGSVTAGTSVVETSAPVATIADEQSSTTTGAPPVDSAPEVTVPALPERVGEFDVNGLQRGDCLDVPIDSGIFYTVQLYACTGSHNSEVTGLMQHPAAGGPYPGEAALQEFGGPVCEDLFEAYVGTRSSITELRSTVMVPIAQEWVDSNMTYVTCIAYRADLTSMSASVAGRAGDADVALGFGDSVGLSLIPAMGSCFRATDPAASLTIASQAGVSQVVKLTSCSEPHSGQLVGVVTLDDRPSYDFVELEAEAAPLCDEQFTLWSALAPNDGVNAVLPDAGEWQSNTRYAMCVFLWTTPVVEYSGTPFEDWMFVPVS